MRCQCGWARSSVNPSERTFQKPAMSEDVSDSYNMTVSLNVINHLGLNLYSNIPAVMSEAVANAWDADASEVRISLDDSSRRIVIADDGHGMTLDTINDRF